MTGDILKQSLRKAAGNILTIAAITGVILLVLALWAIDVFWLHFLSAKELSAAEKVAMAAAVALNRDDSVGQMNYVLAHSRELIYCLRYDEALAESKNSTTLELARALATRTQANARALAEARTKLQTIRMNEAIEAARKAVTTAGSPGDAHMAGVVTSSASLDPERCCFGCLSRTATGGSDPRANVDKDNVSSSNVEPSNFGVLEKGGKELEEYDKQFVDEASKLYKGNISLGMNPPGGGNDTELDLKIASLPACINNYVAPPRLIQASEFQYMAQFSSGSQPPNMPTAVYVVLKLDVKDAQSGSKTELLAPGIAVAGGAAPPP